MVPVAGFQPLPPHEGDDDAEPPQTLVVVGASAGGVEALEVLARELPAELPAAVLVVLHVPATATGGLPEILERAGRLPAEHPTDGAALRPGRIYVAPPDRHLLVRDARVEVVRGRHENWNRPAIDPLFRSAAIWYGPHVVGVVLSGTGDDGSAGAAAVTALGGRVLVQDPGDSAHPAMPRNAIAADSPSRIVPLAEIAPTIVALVAESAKLEEGEMHDPEDLATREARYAALDRGEVAGHAPPGDLGAVERARCRVGHAFTLDALLDCRSEMVEDALRTALRALEERAGLMQRIARRLRTQGMEKRAREFDGKSRQSREHAAVIEKVLLHGDGEREHA